MFTQKVWCNIFQKPTPVITPTHGNVTGFQFFNRIFPRYQNAKEENGKPNRSELHFIWLRFKLWYLLKPSTSSKIRFTYNCSVQILNLSFYF